MSKITRYVLGAFVVVALGLLCYSPSSGQMGYGQKGNNQPKYGSYYPWNYNMYGNQQGYYSQNYSQSGDSIEKRLAKIEKTLQQIQNQLKTTNSYQGDWQVISQSSDGEEITLANVNTGAVKFIYPKFSKVVEKK